MKRLNSKCLFFDRYHDFIISFCSFLIVVLLALFIVVCFCVKFSFNKGYSGVVFKDGDFYVSLDLSDNDLQRIQASLLVVNKVETEFSIVRISDDYMLSSSGPVRRIYLKFDFDDKYKIQNNVIKLNFISKKTIFSRLREMI